MLFNLCLWIVYNFLFSKNVFCNAVIPPSFQYISWLLFLFPFRYDHMILCELLRCKVTPAIYAPLRSARNECL